MLRLSELRPLGLSVSPQRYQKNPKSLHSVESITGGGAVNPPGDVGRPTMDGSEMAECFYMLLSRIAKKVESGVKSKGIE